MPDDDKQLLTVKDVARQVQVDTRTVHRWIGSGELPAIDIGRGYRIKQEDLDAFLEKRRKHPPQKDTLDTDK
jgi:excisionase family DNA binding protein